MGLREAFLRWVAPRPAKSWPLDNQIQAQALAGILEEEGIPFRIRRHGEALWGYAEQAQEGWGHVEVDQQYWSAMDQLYQDFLTSTSSNSETADSGH